MPINDGNQTDLSYVINGTTVAEWLPSNIHTLWDHQIFVCSVGHIEYRVGLPGVVNVRTLKKKQTREIFFFLLFLSLSFLIVTQEKDLINYEHKLNRIALK